MSEDTSSEYRLAKGEEVISNMLGQAEHWRGLLEQISEHYRRERDPDRGKTPPETPAV